MCKLLSPLRYPGGKNSLVSYFETVVKENLLIGAHLYEPYAGGASISLQLLQQNLISKTTLVERDPLIYALWKSVKTQPEELCKKIEQIDVTLATWHSFQKYLSSDALSKFPTLELGLAGLFFNRTNFSGILNAGPIGGKKQESEYTISCRFNKDRIIDQIITIAKFGSKLSVVFGDALSYLRKNNHKITQDHSLVYLDPPYFQQGHKLYRYHYALQQHQSLAEFIMKAKYPWIVSYDNHQTIIDLFEGQKITPIYLNYAVRKSRIARELLISNIKLANEEYESELENLHSTVAHELLKKQKNRCREASVVA